MSNKAPRLIYTPNKGIPIGRPIILENGESGLEIRRNKKSDKISILQLSAEILVALHEQQDEDNKKLNSTSKSD